MDVLFTKKISKEALIHLDPSINYNWIDVISTESINFEEINIDNKALIFTSINAVKSFFENKTALQLSTNQVIFCVGTLSKNLLESKGFSVLETTKNAEDLSQILVNKYANLQYIHFCGDIALPTIGNYLSKENIAYQKVVCYQNTALFPKVDKNHDAIVFFSPSGVRSFVKYNKLDQKTIFSIGETTSNEIKNWTNTEIITSPENTVSDLLMLINNYSQQ